MGSLLRWHETSAETLPPETASFVGAPDPPGGDYADDDDDVSSVGSRQSGLGAGASPSLRRLGRCSATPPSLTKPAANAPFLPPRQQKRRREQDAASTVQRGWRARKPASPARRASPREYERRETAVEQAKGRAGGLRRGWARWRAAYELRQWRTEHVARVAAQMTTVLQRRAMGRVFGRWRRDAMAHARAIKVQRETRQLYAATSLFRARSLLAGWSAWRQRYESSQKLKRLEWAAHSRWVALRLLARFSQWRIFCGMDQASSSLVLEGAATLQRSPSEHLAADAPALHYLQRGRMTIANPGVLYRPAPVIVGSRRPISAPSRPTVLHALVGSGRPAPRMPSPARHERSSTVHQQQYRSPPVREPWDDPEDE